MAVEFLSDEQAAGFGRFPDEVSQEDLERFCWLDDTDLSIVARRRGTHNRLGFAVQLATVRVVGRFLTDPLAVPWPVVESLAGQLGIADASVLKLYAQRGQTGYEHAEEISAVYGYVDFADPVKYEELKMFLSAQAWTSSVGPVRLFERAAVLNLLTAAIVLWNTVYLERAANAVGSHDPESDDTLLQYLSPLGWEHINLTGDHTWRNSAKPGTGKFRPLRPASLP